MLFRLCFAIGSESVEKKSIDLVRLLDNGSRDAALVKQQDAMEVDQRLERTAKSEAGDIVVLMDDGEDDGTSERGSRGRLERRGSKDNEPYSDQFSDHLSQIEDDDDDHDSEKLRVMDDVNNNLVIHKTRDPGTHEMIETTSERKRDWEHDTNDEEESNRSSELIMSSQRWNKENELQDDNMHPNQNHPAFILSRLRTCKNGNQPPSRADPNANDSFMKSPTFEASDGFTEPITTKKSPASLLRYKPTSSLTASGSRLLHHSSSYVTHTSSNRYNINTSIPKPSPKIHMLSLSSTRQQEENSKLGLNEDANLLQNTTGPLVPRLTPRAPAAKKRMHR